MAIAYSWGRYPRGEQARHTVFWPGEIAPALRAPGPLLPYGLGRSYGDSCQNAGGALLDMSRLDRFVSWDARAGHLRCEAGTTLGQVLRFAVPRGWFLPVVPGTRFVTVGGAIANDVHGKNHHIAGTFGHHVLEFELHRSTSGPLRCSAAENPELFRATLGGLGLTGVIASAVLALRPVVSSFLDVETTAFEGLDEFLRVEADAVDAWEYTVSWIDCSNSRHPGLHQRARAVARADGSLAGGWSAPRHRVPVDLPAMATSAPVVRLFNALYRAVHPRSPRRIRAERFLFPLDRVLDWNRIYGRSGFVQFQCVVPPGEARSALQAILDAILRSGEGSPLSVLKTFGSSPAAGMLSFARPGTTFALDFPVRGASTFALLDRLEAVAIESGGAIYPAKDARMSARAFRRSFPELDAFERHIDPALSSSLWRRVHANP